MFELWLIAPGPAQICSSGATACVRASLAAVQFHPPSRAGLDSGADRRSGGRCRLGSAGPTRARRNGQQQRELAERAILFKPRAGTGSTAILLLLSTQVRSRKYRAPGKQMPEL